MKFIFSNAICILMIFALCGIAATKDKEEIKNTKEEDYIKKNLKSDMKYETNNNIENANKIKNFIVGRWGNDETGYEFFNSGIVEINYIIGFHPHMTMEEMDANELREKGEWNLGGNKLTIKINKNEFIYNIEKYELEYRRKRFRKFELMLFFTPELYKAGNRLWRSFN
jgi:hypothetical protein